MASLVLRVRLGRQTLQTHTQCVIVASCSVVPVAGICCNAASSGKSISGCGVDESPLETAFCVSTGSVCSAPTASDTTAEVAASDGEAMSGEAADYVRRNSIHRYPKEKGRKRTPKRHNLRPSFEYPRTQIGRGRAPKAALNCYNGIVRRDGGSIPIDGKSVLFRQVPCELHQAAKEHLNIFAVKQLASSPSSARAFSVPVVSSSDSR